MATKRVRFGDNDDADEIPNSRLMKKSRIDELDAEEVTYDVFVEREKKHTLDSDEEDDTGKYERFDAEKFEGQEAATQEYDGKTKIMPFNMDEDMEEGHFDKDGTFIYNKKNDDIKDAWLDNINWDNVKNSAGKLWNPDVETKEDNNDNDGNREDAFPVEEVYEKLLTFLSNKTETIAAALKRLNSERGLSAAEERKQRWAAKKAGKSFEPGNVKAVSELTALADSLISNGCMEAYQLTSEKIQGLLTKSISITDKTTVETSSEPFDMFGDQPVSTSTPSTSSTTTTSVDASIDPDSATMWEYRAMKSDGELEETISGPVTTCQIAKMQEDNQFKHGARVRRVGTDVFYDIKRIDFDLYD